ncbi:response regulator [Patulibacter medicamentivorans]|nr:response regulator transcription factor [Patulibacter medicamentivorans]
MIVDDHDLVRHGIRSVLAGDSRVRVVAEASTGGLALRQAAAAQLDLALVDLRLPDMRGEDVVRGILEVRPQAAIVVVSAYLSEDTVRGALQAGAIGYVTKTAGLTELRTVIDRVVRGERGSAEVTGHQIVERLHSLGSEMSGRPSLTPQQERVLELAAAGWTYQQVGAKLFITESTVRFHVQKMKRKFAARTKTELIATAIRAGVLAPAAEAGPVCLERAS